jgi:hypothetical protein
MDPELAKLLTEVIEKAGLLRRDMQQHGDLDKYEARFARIDQKLQTAWQLPARSLAFRNAEHKKKN